MVVYNLQVPCNVGPNTLALPEYFSWLASSPLVQVSPFQCFGIGWGEMTCTTLVVTVDLAGVYNVTVWGTRADDMANAEFAEFGVEYAA